MVQAAMEGVRPPPASKDSPIVIAHNQMRRWITCFVERRQPIVLPESCESLVLNDLQPSLNLPLPQKFRERLREQAMCCIISPVDEGMWSIDIKNKNIFKNPINKRYLMQNYRAVLQQIGRAQKEISQGVMTDSDLVELRKMAYDFFDLFPESVQDELRNQGSAPETVISSKQSTS